MKTSILAAVALAAFAFLAPAVAADLSWTCPKPTCEPCSVPCPNAWWDYEPCEWDAAPKPPPIAWGPTIHCSMVSQVARLTTEDIETLRTLGESLSPELRAVIEWRDRAIQAAYGAAVLEAEAAG